MIAKRKARRVIVNGNAFRHKISLTPKSKGIYDLNITAQSEMHNASRLLVKGLIQKDSNVLPLNDHSEYGYYTTVTRHEVEWLVREAIDRGWDFTASGFDFTITTSIKIFELGFLGTQDLQDRVRREIVTSTTNKQA